MTTARLSGGGEYLMNGVARRPHRYKVRFVNHAGKCTPGDQPCKSWRGVGSLVTSEARQILEHAIEVRCGGIYLRLTLGQYAKLRS
jgi:hypothetical protein